MLVKVITELTQPPQHHPPVSGTEKSKGQFIVTTKHYRTAKYIILNDTEKAKSRSRLIFKEKALALLITHETSQGLGMA